MWTRVKKPQLSDEISEVISTPLQTAFSDLVIKAKSAFEDSVFVISPSSGLTIDCSESSLKLFEAKNREQLIGIDLMDLFDPSWPMEERRQIKLGLEKSETVKVQGVFRTLSKKSFPGELEAIRMTDGAQAFINVRIYPVAATKAVANVLPENGFEWFDNAAFPMAIIGMNYGFQRVNEAFCKLTGYVADELKQLSIIELIHPDDRQMEKKALSTLFRGEISLSKREKRLIKRNNEICWISTTSSLSKDKNGHPKFIISMTENITQRKRAEKVLSENKNKLTSLVENAEYSVLTVDKRHTIQLINSKLSNLLFTQTGIIVETGFNLLDILPEVFHKDYLEIHQQAFEGKEFVKEKNFTINGKKANIELVITPVRDESGLIRNISIFGHDISSRKKQEEEIIKEKEEAIAATQAKSGFLATMSHEIRTPLNGVIGMGRLLSQTQLTPKQQEFVDSILLSGDALLSVINDILDYSKIESAKMELEYKPFSLKRCVEETFDLLASKAIEKNLSLQYSIASDVPTYIYGDITRLRQVLMNLVSNSIKFTPKGKITIGVTKKEIGGSKMEVRFDVKDTGIGLTQDKIKRLFKSFTQADADTAKKYGGTGLGLVICKNLVELMNGRIWVESKEGEGSDFIFTMMTQAVAKQEIPKNVKNGANKLANSYVLIISDDKTEAALYADYFKRWGMIPQIAEDVNRALESVKQRKDYNIVLIDAQLVNEKPLRLAQEIRNIRSQDELPIVLFNAVKTDDIFFDYTGDVVSAVIPKNVDRSKVLDILIGVFSVEEHQRSRDENSMQDFNKKLADEIPMRILIAEDNIVNQKLAQNIFEGFGYSPVIVSNGLQVIDELRKDPFDLIFMDVQMPEMDGFEATRFIRVKMDLTKRPVIVAMTAFALEGDKEKCIEAGMDDYISKPFLVEEIIERIRKWSPDKIEPVKTEKMRTKNSEAIVILNMNTVNRLKEMTAGSDPSFFSEVIKMFINQADEEVYEMSKAFSSKNLSLLTSHAHKLKGSALNLGAEAMAETCRKIEINGKDIDIEDLDVLVKRLAQQLILTKGELKSLI